MRLRNILKVLPILFGLYLFAGCEERDEISDRNRLYRLEDKFSELESLCNTINKNSENIKKLLQEQSKNTKISNVYKMQDGYVISFSDGEYIELHNGKDGKNGKDGIISDSTGTIVVPVIGVKIAEDGLHYWTLNGEWLLDENGNMVLAEGKNGKDGQDGEDGKDGQGGSAVTPLMKIEGGYWMVSYNEGKTWETIGKATGEDGKDGKDGICPELKIENGVWYISYDKGVTWEAIGSAVGQDGKTPSLKIEDGKLKISWDQGVTWEDVEGGDVFQGITDQTTGVEQGHTWVDLGLPSGNKWASCNIGANSPTEWGNFYAWGDTATKGEYASTNCATFGKVIEQLNAQGYTNGGVLTQKYDAAHCVWGGYWKMPSFVDFKELIDNCTWTWVTNGNVNGYEVKSTKDGNTNSIFLPAAGSRDLYDLRMQNAQGWYWTSTAFTSNDYYSYCVTFGQETSKQLTVLSRRSGFSIRAIYVKP